ncbi:hypothetical protein [uncultured Sphingomonas sp.]|uniref:hypothetical protein n=1 Tax=uncultured Sphingomonas sp. TaxID=158754 RepID=UPI0035CC876C
MSAALLLVVSGCAGPTGGTGRPRSPGNVAITYTPVGLERVLGQDAAGLAKLFGEPDADTHESLARKLQYGSSICVLDAYLYPQGNAEPRVTYLDAREPDGSAIDRASCVAALTRRREAR